APAGGGGHQDVRPERVFPVFAALAGFIRGLIVAGTREALTRPIHGDVVAEQYDQMTKYATAIRAGTALTEAILRRLIRANAIHPTYQAYLPKLAAQAHRGVMSRGGTRGQRYGRAA